MNKHKMPLVAVAVEVRAILKKWTAYEAGDIDNAVNRIVAQWPEYKHSRQLVEEMVIDSILMHLISKVNDMKERLAHAKHTS